MIGRVGGRIRSRHDPRSLLLSRYLTAQLPAPPLAIDWTGNVRYTTSLNDRLSCCTCTGLAHMAECHAGAHGQRLAVADVDVLAAYESVGGYDGTPASDTGAQMIDALTYARNVGIGSYKVGAFMRVDSGNQVEVQTAVSMFGGLYVGADLPKRINTQGDTWTLPTIQEADDKPGSLGGHAFTVLGYSHTKLWAMPWTEKTSLSWDWFGLYVDEAWALVDALWVSGDRPAPNGFDLATLQADLSAIRSV